MSDLGMGPIPLTQGIVYPKLMSMNRTFADTRNITFGAANYCSLVSASSATKPIHLAPMAQSVDLNNTPP
jgi:hypothetical protein